MLNNNKISRRKFTKTIGTAILVSASPSKVLSAKKTAICLGGPVHEKYSGPDEWVNAVNKLGYRAAYCPVNAKTPDDVVKAYETAARKAGIIIAEVGAWSNNPISSDEKIRSDALKNCSLQLDLADRIGANCCVNVSGSRGKEWAGHDKENLTKETFDMIVDATRKIIDEVKPKRTYFALETMPWAYPDSADSYLDLFKAIDRKRFAVHLDPVNLICSPQRYYKNGDIIRECFKKLGKHLKSCHAKDIILQPKLTTHLDEVGAGLGGLNYAVYLKELSKFPGVPLMLEHLKTPEQYKQAAQHVRSVAKGLGLSI